MSDGLIMFPADGAEGWSMCRVIFLPLLSSCSFWDGSVRFLWSISASGPLSNPALVGIPGGLFKSRWKGNGTHPP